MWNLDQTFFLFNLQEVNARIFWTPSKHSAKLNGLETSGGIVVFLNQTYHTTKYNLWKGWTPSQRHFYSRQTDHDPLAHIEVSNRKSELSALEFPLEGYKQLCSWQMSEYHLGQWIPNTEWSPVGGHLVRNDDYIKYHESQQNLAEYAHMMATSNKLQGGAGVPE